ncbi:DoxX family protein [Terrarubrum flagellatum]|uniref:DoxX family protein n=1 Tax=Terrirubrum flagellatum TaxID=2895980 RepID=UPI0031451B06
MEGLNSMLSAWAPRVLSIVRIMAGLLFLQHGLMKLVGFPIAPQNYPQMFSLIWFAGAIEIVGGILLVIGLFSRFAAFIMSGEMAFAYFMSHAPRAFFPIQNNGEAAILFCFVFLYIVFSGPGPWSIDEQRAAKA